MAASSSTRDMTTTFAILGSGGWGTAVAVLLAQNPQHRVRLWSAHADSARQIREKRENVRLLPGIPVPDSIHVTDDPGEAIDAADCWVTAIPTAFLRETLTRFVRIRAADVPVISLTKGLEVTSFRRPTEIIGELLGTERLATLSGPSHAEEVARGMPTSVVVAATDLNWPPGHSNGFGTDRFRVYTNSDLVGVELAGALKNVIGIAAGVCDGLGFGDNAKAALLTRGMVEMTRFGMALGARGGNIRRTGRNRRISSPPASASTAATAASAIGSGKGEPLADVLAGPQVAEGVTTSRSVFERVNRMGIDAPIMTGVYQMLYEGKPPLAVVQDLMTRQQKDER